MSSFLFFSLPFFLFVNTGAWWRGECKWGYTIRGGVVPKKYPLVFFFWLFFFRFGPSDVHDSIWGFFHFCNFMSSAEQNFNGGYVLHTTPFEGKKKDDDNLSLSVPIHLS